ncbi:hypothetical protein H5410_061817 [Solanum commersonii]|uniref:DUF4283 domain-containing protein n=1 Tax=Solanum commersonii TaxID=4109 RepID=A0A9J5W8R5_SOLCO|nr:hypothetical protein H5410_061817 [Solanum commersonii]
MVGTASSIGAMERFIMVHGPFSTKPIILYHIDGYIVVRFANEEETDIVLCLGPHQLLRRPVIMKPWVTEFNFKEEILTIIPLWVKLPDLRLNYWNAVVLSKIGSSLGKPLYANECPSQVNRISLTRILVEVDITRPLPKMIKMHDPKGDVQKKGLNRGKKKEWVLISDRGKVQDKDIGLVTTQVQEVMEHQQGDEVHDQGEWQIVRHKNSTKRDKQDGSANATDTGENSCIEDKAIGNAAWMGKMPTLVMAIEPLFSDHSLLGLIVEKQRDTQKRPFRMYNSL